MAIYHFSVKAISRGTGRSAVACAAYRSGEKLICNYYGKEQDYTHKKGVEFKNIYAPIFVDRSLTQRQNLWNEVEQAERRKDATLAREFEIAFPHELNARQRELLLDELCSKIVERHNVVVDAAIHAPHTASGSDERNYHAHIMFTSRQIDKGTGKFAAKKNRDFNKEHSSETIKQWREEFALICNKYLEQANSLQRVDHRSYRDQNIDLEATLHEGSKITQLRRQGISTEISLTNDAIKQRNAEKVHLHEFLKGLEQEIILSEAQLAKYTSEIAIESPKQPILAHEEENLENLLLLEKEVLNTLKTHLYELYETQSMLHKKIEQISLAEPKQSRLLGLVANPEHEIWKNEFNELTNQLTTLNQQIRDKATNVEHKESKVLDFSEKWYESLLNQMTDIQKQYYQVFLKSVEHRNQVDIQRYKKEFFNTYQKDEANFGSIEKQFNYVFKNLNTDQVRAYEDMKKVIEQKFQEPLLAENLKNLKLKVIQKYIDDPKFKVPKEPENINRDNNFNKESSPPEQDRGR